MFITLKIVHFLALLLGGAASVTPAVAMRALKRTGHSGPPPPALALTLRVLGIGSLIAILLLWGTGLGMYTLKYQGADLGTAFIVKMAVATLILIIAVWLNLMATRAARTGEPANAGRVRLLGYAARGLLIIAIIAAVLSFSL